MAALPRFQAAEGSMTVNSATIGTLRQRELELLEQYIQVLREIAEYRRLIEVVNAGRKSIPSVQKESPHPRTSYYPHKKARTHAAPF